MRAADVIRWVQNEATPEDRRNVLDAVLAHECKRLRWVADRFFKSGKLREAGWLRSQVGDVDTLRHSLALALGHASRNADGPKADGYRRTPGRRAR